MRKCVCCFLLLFHSFFYMSAINNLRMADIRNMGMGGGNGVTLSPLYNPALVALCTENTVRINYFNRYGLKELGNYNGSLYLPNTILSFGIDISAFGYDAYRENLFRLLLGKQLSRKWTIGVGFQYAFVQTELYEEKISQLSTDIGLVYSPVDNLLIGVLLMNTPSAQMGDKSFVIKDFEAWLLQLGFNWKVINNVLIVCSLESNDEYPLAFGAGIEYTPFTDFCVRAGIKSKPFLPAFGVGYRLAAFTIDVAAVFHPVLGVSSGIGFQLSF